MFFFLLLTTLCLSVVVAEPIPSLKADKQPEELEFLGEVDGKGFYAGNEEITWDDARKLCLAKNLQFATVETKEEEAFLNQTLSARFLPPTWISHYWTSGRDRATKEQYIWDSTNGELGDLSEISFYGYQTCLTFRVPDYKTVWRARECADVWPAICQS